MASNCAAPLAQEENLMNILAMPNPLPGPQPGSPPNLEYESWEGGVWSQRLKEKMQTRWALLAPTQPHSSGRLSRIVSPKIWVFLLGKS